MKVRRFALWIVLAVLALVAGAAWFFSAPGADGVERAIEEPAPSSTGPTEPAPAMGSTSATPPPTFVGSASCEGCHKAEAALYKGSHHQLALRMAEPGQLAGNFADQVHNSKWGGKTEFHQGANGFGVIAPSSTGEERSFSVIYVAGVAPLEQYIVDGGGGHLQSLGVAWQTVSEHPNQAAQRWFHVYGASEVAPSSPLYFTEPAQNWNHVCADCHSTNVERRYDPAKNEFSSTWSELSVGCEACHGPGSNHVAAGGHGGLTTQLVPSTPWVVTASGSPAPHPVDDRQLEGCAPCHSRRETLREGHRAGDAYLDFFEPELLRAARYQSDGQLLAEVYEWGSFQQSKMHAAGVRCSDCHDAHSGKLKAQGDALCTNCHAPDRFASSSHTHHQPGPAAPSCVSCHMPSHTFMDVDVRHDHSLRIPRPDLSVALNTSNACNDCHEDKSVAWAADAATRWFAGLSDRKHFGAALALEHAGRRGAAEALRALAAEVASPAIARATALELLGQHPGEATVETLRKHAFSPEPLVAYGAALGAARQAPPARYELLIPMLSHPRRAVRIAVGKGLADVPLAELSPEALAALRAAFLEIEESFAVAAPLPATRVEQAAFELRRGQLDAAKKSLRAALALDSGNAAAWVNLAELARQSDDEAANEKALARALDCDPDSAEAHFALGLSRIRQGEQRKAVAELAAAVRLAPTNAQFALALAACHDALGQVGTALTVVERALKLREEDSDLWGARSVYQDKLGDHQGAGQSQVERARLLR